MDAFAGSSEQLNVDVGVEQGIAGDRRDAKQPLACCRAETRAGRIDIANVNDSSLHGCQRPARSPILRRRQQRFNQAILYSST
jgi:hypothetical protein